MQSAVQSWLAKGDIRVFSLSVNPPICFIFDINILSVLINKGNPYLKSMLCEVAWIMASHRKLYLSGWYWKVKQRKGAKRATIALARKILSIIYTMLKTGTPYNEECFEQRRLRCERKRANRLVNELQKLGYVVVAPD